MVIRGGTTGKKNDMNVLERVAQPIPAIHWALLSSDSRGVCASGGGLLSGGVQVMYEPSETTYENLLRIFFGRHDPTQVNGQGNDKGTQYRAGVYFHDDEQV